MRTELYQPPKTIRISATAARAHLFELFDLIAEYDLTCIITVKDQPAAQITCETPGLKRTLISPSLLRALSHPRRGTRKNEAISDSEREEVVNVWLKPNTRSSSR
jgi:hypothetical protein